MTKRIAILGSTGSVGKNALRVIDALGAEYSVVALSANSNVQLLTEQVKSYKPKFVAITNADYLPRLKELVRGVDVEILAGPGSLVKIAEFPDVDIVLTAVVGAAGLASALAAAGSGKRLAIANKEPLVIAGQMLTTTAREKGGTILPVDSEHSAICQAMRTGSETEVAKIILTASGGPFRKTALKDLQNVTLEQALAHPVWDMGPKITIDSATMVNKAFEVIEAHWLFNMPVEKIDVLIHPESIVHSLVEFVDGSVIAQLGEPDMCLPIQYALTYPSRLRGIGRRLRLEEIGQLTFEKPDFQTFRALPLGYEVARVGGTAPVVFNAANEAAVQKFLDGSIRFIDIVKLIERCLDKHNVKPCSSLQELLEADAWARKQVELLVMSFEC